MLLISVCEPRKNATKKGDMVRVFVFSRRLSGKGTSQKQVGQLGLQWIQNSEHLGVDEAIQL